jgi:hypothetical protein
MVPVSSIAGISAHLKHRNNDDLDFQWMVNGWLNENICFIGNAGARKDKKEKDEAKSSWQHWARIEQITYHAASRR